MERERERERGTSGREGRRARELERSGCKEIEKVKYM